ncbi:MAG: hypothetical protein ACR2OZ_10665 [Verrucomicrobiales bacterium]
MNTLFFLSRSRCCRWTVPLTFSVLLFGGCVVAPPPTPHQIIHRSPLPHHRIIASLPHHAHPVMYRGERCWECDGRYYRQARGGYELWD